MGHRIVDRYDDRCKIPEDREEEEPIDWSLHPVSEMDNIRLEVVHNANDSHHHHQLVKESAERVCMMGKRIEDVPCNSGLSGSLLKDGDGFDTGGLLEGPTHTQPIMDQSRGGHIDVNNPDDGITMKLLLGF
jgi:hypothetical protein